MSLQILGLPYPAHAACEAPGNVYVNMWLFKDMCEIMQPLATVGTLPAMTRQNHELTVHMRNALYTERDYISISHEQQSFLARTLPVCTHAP